MLESNLSTTSSPASTASQSTVVAKSADSTSSTTATSATSTAAGTTPSSSVSLSPAALALLASESIKPAAPEVDYTVYFAPVRQGYTAMALWTAVSDPGALSSSAGKTMAETATAARASMDQKYQAMKDSGTKFNVNDAYGVDGNSLMGDLDRRSLLAIRENVGGLFTEAERTHATDLMRQQQGLAMGLYSGPSKFASRFMDPYANDNLGRLKAAAAWLDKVSDDEKMSGEWRQQRDLVARTIASYGEKPDDEEPFDYWSAIRAFAEKMRKQGEEHDATMEAMLSGDTPAVPQETSGLASAIAPEAAMDGLTGVDSKTTTGTASKRSSGTD